MQPAGANNLEIDVQHTWLKKANNIYFVYWILNILNIQTGSKTLKIIIPILCVRFLF